MDKKSKTKLFLPKNLVSITPLSIDDCVNEISKMASIDFEVKIGHQLPDSAYIQLVEHRGDQPKLYVSCDLKSMNTSTHIIFKPYASKLPEWLPEERNRKKEFIVDAAITLAIVSAAVMIQFPFIISNIESPALRCLIPIDFILFGLLMTFLKSRSDKIDKMYANDRSIKIRYSMIFNDVTQVLKINSDSIRYDEHGNPYLIDRLDT